MTVHQRINTIHHQPLRRLTIFASVFLSLLLLWVTGNGGSAGTVHAASTDKNLYMPVALTSPAATTITGTTYYVDCSAGNDANSGTSPAQAWNSLVRANKATLKPGDGLLLKRGCRWTAPLRAAWTGTASAPITISAYGTGELPLILDGPYQNIDITGSYQIIEYLEARLSTPPSPDPNCANQPTGWRVGFNFHNGASYNILRNSKASTFAAGAHLNTDTHHNKVIGNTFTNNNVMIHLTPISVAPKDDLGAWGILLKGSYQEIANNYLANNNSFCNYDDPQHNQGNAIELFEGQHNVIHHNISVNNRDFSELGGSDAVRADDNTYAYNLHVSSFKASHFLIVRGGGNQFGPTWRTKAFNNTVYLTDAESVGIICGAGCSSDILVLKNNILWANYKSMFADAPFLEKYNIFWNTAGDPFVQFLGFGIDSTSKLANPQFVNAGARDFHLQSISPAIDAGITLSWKYDLSQVSVPQLVTADIGAYERSSN